MEQIYDGNYDEAPEELRAILPSPLALRGMSGAVSNLMTYGELDPIVMVEHEERYAVQFVPEWDEESSKWVPMVAAVLNARLALEGGNHVLLVIDTWQSLSRTGQVEVSPSEDPEGHEAIFISELKGLEVIGTWTMAHGRDDSGEVTTGPWMKMPGEMEGEMMHFIVGAVNLPLDKVGDEGVELMRRSYPEMAEGLLVMDS